MKKLDTPLRKLCSAALLALIITLSTGISASAQITFNDEGYNNPDNRKIRKAASKYKATRAKSGDFTETHLNMKNYSFKRGEPGYRGYNEELETEEAYNIINPLNRETAVRETKKKGIKKKKK